MADSAQISPRDPQIAGIPPALVPRLQPRSRWVLIVEDGPNDCFLLKRAIKKFPKRTEFVHVFDGEEAIEYLSSAQTPPDLIITDLKMPGMNGFDLLSWTKASPAHATVPMIVFSSSELDVDQRRAKEGGARAYYVKPNAYEEYEALILKICQEYIR